MGNCYYIINIGSGYSVVCRVILRGGQRWPPLSRPVGARCPPRGEPGSSLEDPGAGMGTTVSRQGCVGI